MTRHVILESLLLPLLLIAGTVCVRAQERWDDILDRYATICDQCIELRQLISAGEAVPDKSVSSLLQELSTLRKTLQDASGAMTPAQRTRFQTIQQRYAAASGERSPIPSKQVQSAPVPKRAPVAREPEQTNVSVPRDTVLLPTGTILPSGKAVTLQVPGLTDPATLHHFETMTDPGVIVIPDPPLRKHSFIDVLALYGHGTASSFGMMAAGSIGRWGAWVAGRSNFTPAGAAYDCSSNGQTASGKFWGNGQSRFGIWSVSGGPLWCPLPWLGVYAGAGYAREELDWQDAENQWARVRDYSYSGICWDAGVMLHWKHLAISAGCDWSRHFTVTIGLGVHF